INRSTNPADLKRFNDQIGRLQTQINNIKVVGFETSMDKLGASATTASNRLKSVPDVANRSTTTLIDLGRVLQDAPYGFIGVANNINPLLENFQRLQREAGGSKAALRALVQGMVGGGGLGLGL